MKNQTRHFVFVTLLLCLFACLHEGASVLHCTTTVATPASCVGPDGQSRCGLTPKWNRTQANLLGTASGGDRAAIIPPSWTVPAWYIDPTNSTTCASDNNNCTSATCGSVGSFVGPCVTYGEIAARFGTYSPRLRQNTTLTLLSGQTTETDPVYFSPIQENGSYALIQGTPAVAFTTTTLATVTAKNRTTPQLLAVTFTTGAPAVGQLLVNTTHPSEAWVYSNPSGSTWDISQPLSPASTTVIGSPIGSTAAEVNTWAIGDTVIAYTLPALYLADVEPITEQLGTAGLGGVFVYNLTIASTTPTTLGSSPFVMGSLVVLVDTLSQRQVAGTPSRGVAVGLSSNVGFSQEIYNSYLQGGMWNAGLPGNRTGASSAAMAIFGGVISTVNNSKERLGYVEIEQDTILGTAAHGLHAIYGGSVNAYIDTSQTLTLSAAAVDVSGGISSGGSATIWGPGAVQVAYSGRLTYPAGAGGAAASLLMTGGINFNGSSVGCIAIPTAGTMGACNTTLSATVLDSSLGATAGCIIAPGSGSVCNYGP